MVDYVVLNVDRGAELRKFNLYRAWNQLSRLQRSLINVCGLVVILVWIYIWLNNQKQNYPVVINKNSIIDQSKRLVLPKLESDSDRSVILESPQVLNEIQKKPDIPVVQSNGVLPLKIKKFKGPQNDRQKAIVAAFKHAWAGYKKYAWGHDMLMPISKKYHDWFNLGLTIVDSLDTMLILNLTEEFKEGRDWIAQSLDFDQSREVNLFEVTIRVLGGLLSAHHLTNDKILLDKALDLGERLLPCFDSPSGVPFSDINLATKRAHSPKWNPDSSTSEVTTIQLEFRDLTRSTGDPRFEIASSKVSEHVHKLPKNQGLVPIFISAHTGEFRSFSTITLGARGDSYYEYLLKQWIQTGCTIDYLKQDYLEAIAGVNKLLVRRTPKNNLLYIGELITGGQDFKPKMDHLTCYLSGTLALGFSYGMPETHMQLAEELAYTCYMTYAIQPTFLAPEISYFSLHENSGADIYVKNNDAHNLLRPEFVESLWIMYQITGNTTYQDWGWTIFQAFEKYAKVANGYTSLGSVNQVQNTHPKDMMESFFLGETLKYLYLLLSDDRYEIDLKQFVVNTEAHPLPIYAS